MDINRERYSVPFFLEPGFYSDVGVNWISIWTGVFVHKVIGYTVTRYENHVTELEFFISWSRFRASVLFKLSYKCRYHFRPAISRIPIIVIRNVEIRSYFDVTSGVDAETCQQGWVNFWKPFRTTVKITKLDKTCMKRQNYKKHKCSLCRFLPRMWGFRAIDELWLAVFYVCVEGARTFLRFKLKIVLEPTQKAKQNSHRKRRT